MSKKMTREKIKRAIDNVGIIAVLLIMLPSLNFIIARVMWK